VSKVKEVSHTFASPTFVNIKTTRSRLLTDIWATQPLYSTDALLNTIVI
jgi:hypothetical protein